MTNTPVGTTTASPPATFATRFGPRGAYWWWIWIAVTSGVLGAHLVAERFSLAWGAVIVLTIVMTAPLSNWITHQRAWALLLGTYAAFCFFIALELYLGTTGLYYGPIGSAGRPFRDVDTFIIKGLLVLYRHSDIWKAVFSPLIAFALYFVFVHFMPKTSFDLAAHLAAGLAIFVSVFFWFPFTDSLEGRHVAFSKAVLSASGAKKTLGSYKESVDALTKEVAALKKLAEVMQGTPSTDRDALLEQIRRYARLVLEANKKGKERNAILRRREAQYEARRYLEPLRPKERYPIQPDRRFTPQASEGFRDQNLSALDVANSDDLQAAETAMLSGANALRSERDELLVEIRRVVGNEIRRVLGEDWDQDLADAAVFGIVQTIAALELREALALLSQRINELEAAIRDRNAQNQQLKTAIDQYVTATVDVARNQSVCSGVISDLSSYMRSGGGRELIRLVSTNPGRAKQMFDPGRLPGREVSQPRLPDLDVDRNAIEAEISERLRSENIAPPQLSWNDFQRMLLGLPQGEGSASPISDFAASACRRGQSSGQIIAQLESKRLELAAPPR